MGTSEFDEGGERKKDYCKARFIEGGVTDVLKIRQRRTDYEEKTASFPDPNLRGSEMIRIGRRTVRTKNLWFSWTTMIPGAHYFREIF